MDHDFWHTRWQTGKIGFHTPHVHWGLNTHWPALTGRVELPVLVPLCGKTEDMQWLSERGHPVTGVELSEIAVRDFFEERRRHPKPIASDTHGLPGFQDNPITLWQGDFFRYTPGSPFRLFYDRAALIALPPSMRKPYMVHLHQCLEPGATGLVITLEYDQNQKDGPPFSIDYEEMSGYGMFGVEQLERRDVLLENSKFATAGISSLYETVYRLVAV